MQGRPFNIKHEANVQANKCLNTPSYPEYPTCEQASLLQQAITHMRHAMYLFPTNTRRHLLRHGLSHATNLMPMTLTSPPLSDAILLMLGMDNGQWMETTCMANYTQTFKPSN